MASLRGADFVRPPGEHYRIFVGRMSALRHHAFSRRSQTLSWQNHIGVFTFVKENNMRKHATRKNIAIVLVLGYSPEKLNTGVTHFINR